MTGPKPAEAPALVVDALGQRCPMPVISLAQRIGEVPVGALVEVLSDDPAARHDVPAWCRMRGHAYEGERAAGAESGDRPGYLVRRLH